MRALCFGSLNIDYVYQVPHFVGGGETLAAGSLSRFSGGKGLNQSIALARAGLEAWHAGAIGRDGRFLLEELQEAGVRTGYVEVLEDVSTGHATRFFKTVKIKKWLMVVKNPDQSSCKNTA